MTQTAVQWLLEQITDSNGPDAIPRYNPTVNLKPFFDKALEMERMQHRMTWINGFCSPQASKQDNGVIPQFEKFFEQKYPKG